MPDSPWVRLNFRHEHSLFRFAASLVAAHVHTEKRPLVCKPETLFNCLNFDFFNQTFDCYYPSSLVDSDQTFDSDQHTQVTILCEKHIRQFDNFFYRKSGPSQILPGSIWRSAISMRVGGNAFYMEKCDIYACGW